jgi:hypothetical protein
MTYTMVCMYRSIETYSDILVSKVGVDYRAATRGHLGVRRHLQRAVARTSLVAASV